MTPLKVLVDARKARDFGIGRHVLGLLGALGRRDDVATTALVKPGEESAAPEGVAAIPEPAGLYSLSELFCLGGRVRRRAPDVFHTPHYVLPFRAPRASVVTVHDLMHVERPEHAGIVRRAYARTVLRHAVASAARVIAVSEHTARALAAFDERAASKTVVIPNGVDPRFRVSPAIAERSRVRSAHGLPMPYVLFLGNDKPHKNLDGLLHAWARLRREGPLPHRLVLAGGAPERAGARRASIEGLGVAGTVHDLGVVPDADVAPLLAEADALVLPSFAEGFGLPVLEAQGLGTPVACSNAGGLPEAAGDAALPFDPADEAAIASAIRRLLTDEPLRRDLAAKGVERAGHFDWEGVAERTVRVYRDALGGT